MDVFKSLMILNSKIPDFLTEMMEGQKEQVMEHNGSSTQQACKVGKKQYTIVCEFVLSCHLDLLQKS